MTASCDVQSVEQLIKSNGGSGGEKTANEDEEEI